MADAAERFHNGAAVIAVAVPCLVLSTVAVALRLYTRIAIVGQLWVDDFMALATWVGVVAIVIANFFHVRDGLGTHLVNVPDMTSFLKDVYIGLVIYNTTLLFMKLTFFLQFYRVVRSTDSCLRWPYLILMGLIGAWTLAQIFLNIFSCVPIRANWDLAVPGRCQPVNLSRLVNAIGNIVTDVVILLMPLPVIYGLQLLSWRQKLALAAVFGIGSFTTVISILRLVLQAPAADITHSLLPVIAWTTAELTTGTVCAALSTLRPLLHRYSRQFETTLVATTASPGTATWGRYHKHSSSPSRDRTRHSATGNAGQQEEEETQIDASDAAPNRSSRPRYLETLDEELELVGMHPSRSQRASGLLFAARDVEPSPHDAGRPGSDVPARHV